METRTWTVDAEECEGSGLNELCNIVATGTGGKLNIVKKILSCGCVLRPDVEEVEA